MEFSPIFILYVRPVERDCSGDVLKCKSTNPIIYSLASEWKNFPSRQISIYFFLVYLWSYAMLESWILKKMNFFITIYSYTYRDGSRYNRVFEEKKWKTRGARENRVEEEVLERAWWKFRFQAFFLPEHFLIISIFLIYMKPQTKHRPKYFLMHVISIRAQMFIWKLIMLCFISLVTST